jgi:hypothetical protein
MFKQTPKRRVLLLHRLTPVLVLLFGVFSLLLISLHSPRLAYASAADTVNFQARLQTASGAIAPDGDYNIEFKLYSASTGGSALWTEDYLNSNSQGLQTVDGYFTADLGSITPFPSTIDWSQQLYLTMNVGGTGSSITQSYSVNASGWDGEMSPRLTLTATPYAFEAQQATQAGELSTTDGSNTSTLSIQGSTHGDQTFEIQDQGAAGTYDLLTTAQANNNYIQLQTGTPVQQIGEIDVSGSATTGSVETSSLDTASSGSIDIGGTNATAINLGNTTTNIATTINGTVIVKPTTGHDSTTAFQVQNATDTATDLDVDTTDGRVGIGTAAPNYTLDVAGDINTSESYFINGTTALSGTALNFTNTTVPTPSTVGFSSTATAAGNSLSIIGQGGSTATTGAAGGTVFLQGGAAGGTAANNGGGLTLQGGTGTEMGVGGQLTLEGGYAGIHILSTLYAYPTLTSWSQVESAYPTDDVTIVDICAPDGSGSGCNGSPADAITPAWSPTIAALDNAGVTPLLYIATSYGATSLATIEGEMQNAYTWYGITNFAFDEMEPSGSCSNGSSTLTCTTYYNDLYTYAVNMGANTVLFNPGTTYNVSTADMFGPKEVLEVYEGTATNFETTTFPSWMSNYPASEFSANINSGTTSTIGIDVSDAVADGIGNFYENDETGTINYATLPAFWTTEISDVSNADGTEGSVSIDAGAGGTLGSGSIDIGDSYAGTINIGNDSLAHTTVGGSSEVGSDVVLQADGITDTFSGSTTAPSDILKANSTGAFQVQNSSGTNVFNVDTTDQQVTASQNSSSAVLPTLSLIQNGSSSSTLALQNSTTNSAFYLSDNVSNSNALTINSYTAATTTTTATTPTEVQATSVAASASAATQTLAFTSNNTAGNTIIVAASWQDTGLTPTCTDSQGNAYAVMILKTDAANDSQSGICYATNIKAGANTVTVTYGSSASPTYRSLAIQEESGITSSPVDTYVANTTTGTTGTNSYTSTAGTTTTSGDLIFGFFVDETGNSATATAGTGFTQRTDNTTLTSPITTEDLVQSTVGSIAATQTETAADEYVGMMMAFKAGTAGGSLTNTNTNALFTMSQSGQTTLRNSTNSTSAFQIQNASGTTLLGVDTSGNNINVGATGSTALASTVNIATSSMTSNIQTVNIGSTADASNTVSIQGGTGTGAVSVQAGTSGTITIGNQTASTANTINIGSTTTNANADNVNINTEGANTGSTTIGGAGNATGAVTLGQSTGTNTINIGNGNTATGDTQTVNIGDGTDAGNGDAAVTIGNQNGASSTTIQGGSGNVSVLANSGSINLGQISVSTGIVGWTGIGSDTDGSNVVGLTASTFTTTSGGTIGSMSTYISAPLASGDSYQFAIYTNNAGVPGSYVASSAIGTTTASGGWYTLPISATLSATTTYWLVYSSKNGDGTNYNTGVSGDEVYANTYTWQAGPDNGFPSTFPTSGNTTYSTVQASIYATFFSAAQPVVSVSSAGNVNVVGTTTYEDANNSPAAFAVQNASAVNMFVINTSSSTVSIGSGSTGDSTGVILVLDNKTGSTFADPSGFTGAMYYNQASETFRCDQGQLGWTDCLGVPKPNTRRWVYIVDPGSGTSFNAIGDVATISDTSSSAGASSTSAPAVVNMTTSATSGNAAYVAGNASMYDSSNDPDFQTYVKTSSTITNQTIWAGLSSGTTALSGTSNPTQYMAAFRYDTTDSDTHWECVYDNNGTATAVSSGVTVSASTGYKLEVQLSGSTLEFKINGTSVCSNPSFTMTSGEMLGYEDSITESTATAETFGVGWVYIDSTF